MVDRGTFKYINYLSKVYALLLLLLISCAGPHTPFGTLNLLAPSFKGNSSSIEKQNEQSPTSQASARGYYVSFYPDFQLVHRPINLSIRVESFEGAINFRQLRFLYNRIDVTKEIAKNAEIIKESPREIRIRLKNLKFTEDGGQSFNVIVRNTKGQVLHHAYLQEAYCDFHAAHRVMNVGKFNVEPNFISDIEYRSLKGGVNPAIVTGLIAQESGFNPRAVSWARAIGLTQITPLADESLHELTSMWPRHSKIASYPAPLLKGMVSSGLIGHNEDWRLNPSYSVEGGILFLNYIKDYWKLKENKALLDKAFHEADEIPTSVILASYNSGPARVKKAIQAEGSQWMQSSTMKAARKYVIKVSSFCRDFASH